MDKYKLVTASVISSLTKMWTCFVVFIITASPNFFLWIRALAGEFVTHSLGIASVLGLASDISTLVYAFAHAIAVTLVINCRLTIGCNVCKT